MYRPFLTVVIIIILFAVFSCGSVRVEKLYQNGIVVSSSSIASEVGLNVLKQGGNAVDAAVAVAFALSVTHPSAGNIGGGGFALIYNKESDQIRALDFRETAPANATREMFLDRDGEVIGDASLIGARAVGTPGTVAGMYEMWREYGSLKWYNLVEPSVMLADSGFSLSKFQSNFINQYQSGLSQFPESKNIFFSDGMSLKPGDKLIQKDLAATLGLIALDRTDGFYSGKTAELIVAAMELHGGLITADDLSAYRPIWREPIHFRFDSLDVYSMPPPSSGGVIMGMILELLEPFDLAPYTSKSPEYLHLFVEACRLAYVERAKHFGDPAFIDNPVGQILNPAFVETRRKMIDIKQAALSSEIGSGIGEMTGESESTTHFCVADGDGNIVSLTYTINTSFGSKLVVDGAGFLLNNEMDDFSAKPGVPNIYGLVGGEANAIEPGKRMLSSMSPTIILQDGKPRMALGSPGGSRIITAVAQTIINYSRFQLSGEELVSHARYHHQWLPDSLYLETGNFDINIIQDLISRGHIIKEVAPFCEVELIHFNRNGMMSGVADGRRDGGVAGF